MTKQEREAKNDMEGEEESMKVGLSKEDGLCR